MATSGNNVCEWKRRRSNSGSSAKMTKTRSVLSTSMDPSLLRGIRISKVLRGAGVGLKYSPMQVGSGTEYAMSEQVERLDDFVSHDWESNRWMKVVTLCYTYNGHAALIVSLIVGLALAVLQLDDVNVLPKLPGQRRVEIAGQTVPCADGVWSILICPWVFLLVMFHWQQIQDLMCPGRCRKLFGYQVFFDKYCIDQQDEARKIAGVYALAGFMAHCDRLVICWTPRYFTRLWCTFEVASWLYLEKPLSSVKFVPLSRTVAILVFAGSTYLMYSVSVFGKVLMPRHRVLLMVLPMLLAATPCLHWMRHLAQDLQLLPQQIESFSLSNAGCFCCTHDHVMPGTGAPIPCDRRLVCKTVQSWFEDQRPPDAPGQTGYTTERFDRQVQDLFGTWILRNSSLSSVGYRDALVVACPSLFRMMDVLAAWGGPTPHHLLARLVLEHVTECFGSSVLLKLLAYMLVGLNRGLGVLDNKFLDCAATLVATFGFLLMRLTTAFVGTHFRSTCESPVAPSVWTLSLVLLTVGLYSCLPWLREAARQRRSPTSIGAARPQGELRERQQEGEEREPGGDAWSAEPGTASVSTVGFGEEDAAGVEEAAGAGVAVAGPAALGVWVQPAALEAASATAAGRAADPAEPLRPALIGRGFCAVCTSPRRDMALLDAV